MTDALADSLRFPIGGPPLALSQPGRRGVIRQSRIGFPEHGHFGFNDSTASALGGGRVPIICWMPAKKDPPPLATPRRRASRLTQQTSSSSVRWRRDLIWMKRMKVDK